MKIKSITTLATIISIATFILCSSESIILGNNILTSLAISLIVSLIIYGLTYFAVSQYVVRRIKPIYQMMLEKNINSKELSRKAKQEDIVENVSSELSKWANTKSEEIAKLKQLENYRKEFLGNVSHELKTPLFTIQGYLLTIIDEGIADKETTLKFLTNANKGVERMINIVKDLEDISRLEMDIMRLDRTKFDIVKLSHEIIDRMTKEAQERLITISCTSDKEIFVYADHTRIEQVMINLIANSIKYGSKNGHTKIDFIDGFNKVVIEVTDNGVGIAKDDIPRIFERFYRVDKSRSRETGGTGLGLSIVKHILEAHSEKISVRSQLGEYSTFSFSLNKYLS